MKSSFLVAIIAIVLFCPSFILSQKSIQAVRLTRPISIDGIVNLEEWSEASQLRDFIELRPSPGDREHQSSRTEVFLAYTDKGIFIGGTCYEQSRDSISSELIGRDGFGNNDFVGFIFDTYKDQLNAFEYFLTPLNEQMDAKFNATSEEGEDFSWNSIFESATQIHDKGWSFEVFIPFASIRFSPKEIQDWGINIVRRRLKTQEQFFWNEINPKINGFLTQEGLWTGLKDIKPPLRLQLSPYLSYYANHFPNPTDKDITTQFNGGLDLKLGLNQAYTLDATLIPDFGQVQSDPRVLNLTPFEVRFNENRPFFTEGTELFNKGNYFYSRRIGGAPLHYFSAFNQLQEDEALLSNPSETKLINATKISGRGRSGLGIGFLNAITNETNAEAINLTNNSIRKIQTNPLTNYNILVLDQNLNGNSSVSFVNTSVIRVGEDYDANVSSALFNLNNKKNTYQLTGNTAISILNNIDGQGSNETGYQQNLSFNKTSGNWVFNLYHTLTDTKFTSNDLGYFTNNNNLDFGAWNQYRFLKPASWYNQLRINVNTFTNFLFKEIVADGPSLQNAKFNVNVNFQTKKFWWMGGIIELQPKTHDYYEPRLQGQYLTRGSNMLLGAWVETNDNKPYSLNVDAIVRRYFDFYDLTGIDVSLSHRIRFNSKFLINIRTSLQPRYNSVGFSHWGNNGTNFLARRDINTIVNEFNFKYNFTNRMGILFTSRHYKSSVDNRELFTIDRGKLIQEKAENPTVGNRNINFFNIDMVYTWQIAQGSFINVVWKNNIFTNDKDISRDYFANLQQTLAADQNNNLSVKIIYFLDYATIKERI
jgi:hypothetical protein